jgi:amidophosphoribosyltransferase
MCGVAGIYGHPKGREIIKWMNNALKHRGQSATGVACLNTQRGVIDIEKGRGGVDTALRHDKLNEMNGEAWIGHTRYPTQGPNTGPNQQPHYAERGRGRLAIVSNGDVVNMKQQAKFLQANNQRLRTQNDAEVIAASISYHAVTENRELPEAILKMMEHVKGAYSALALAEWDPRLFAFRDPNGIRPLFFARISDYNGTYFLFASETCAIDAAYECMANVYHARGLRVDEIREVEPGELITAGPRESVEKYYYENGRSHRLCLMELFYFSRPDSRYDLDKGTSFNTLRMRLGEQAFKEHGIKTEVFGPVPRSGRPASIGYANAAGIPYAEFILRNPEKDHFRNFIEPERMVSISEKYRIITDQARGKHVGIGDDSIIEALTSRILVRAMRGPVRAKEVEIFSFSPPYRFPCFYGFHTKNPEKLVAANRSQEGINNWIGCPVHYLSLERIYQTEGFERGKHCDACFTGDYPVPILDLEE